MKRTSPKTESHILNQIILGYPYSEIASDTGVAISTIKKIKARNKLLYEANKADFVNWSASEAKTTLFRAYALLNKVLDEADRKERKLSVKDLLRIADMVFLHEQIEVASTNGEPYFKKQRNINRLLSKVKK